MNMNSTKKRDVDRLKSREDAFNLRTTDANKRPEYNALFDPNMRHYFENKDIQNHLYKSGQIDRHGRVIDIDKNKSKVHVLEREFKEVQKIEERRVREEMEMRYRVQKKRFDDLEAIRKQELLQKVRADREISKQIVSILKSSSVLSNSASRHLMQTSGSMRSRNSQSIDFFVTEQTEESMKERNNS